MRAESDQPIYCDRLTFASCNRLVRLRGGRHVVVLDNLGRLRKLWVVVLWLRGITVEDAAFFVGHLKTDDGETVYLAARRQANLAAIEAAHRTVESEPVLAELNRRYGRNTLILFVARQLARHIERWTSRILATRSLCRDSSPLLLLPKPRRFCEAVLGGVCPHVRVEFYRDDVGAAREFVADAVLAVLRIVKQQSVFGSPDKHRPASGRAGLLVLQEESLRVSNHLRNPLHFLARTGATAAFDTVVLKSPKERLFQDDSEFSLPGVVLLPFTALARARKEFRNHPSVRALDSERRKLIRAFWRARSYAGAYFAVRTWFLLSQAQLMAAVSLQNGIRLFVTKEPASTLADALQLIADELGITTIALQYSNVPFISPAMMSTADKYIVFSDLYKSVLAVDGISPCEFHENGYLYDGVAAHVSSRAAAHRHELERRGARFVVCYFDESVQFDRWGLISVDDHLGELHSLAEAVLKQPDFGVVVKSQFMKNSPSQLYPADELIRQAQATGRYLEIGEGAHRNDVYPTEGALVADLCISHKFGATAAIEAAVAGVRTVLIDAYGTRTKWDHIYERANIVFETIDHVLSAVAGHRLRIRAHESLGDWTPILHFFDAAHDGQAIRRTRKIMEDCLLPAESPPA